MRRFIVYLSIVYVAYLMVRGITSGPTSTHQEQRAINTLNSKHLEVAIVWPEAEHDNDSLQEYVHAFQVQLDLLQSAHNTRCMEAPEDKQANLHCEMKPIRLQPAYEEDSSSKQASISQAQAIVQNPNLIAVAGYVNSRAAIPAAVVYENKGVVMLSSGATDARLTQYDFEYIFRHISSDLTHASDIADFIYQQGYIDVFVVNERDSDLYENDFTNYFVEAAVHKGLKVADPILYEYENQDHLNTIAVLKRKTNKVYSKSEQLALSTARSELFAQLIELRKLFPENTSDIGNKKSDIISLLVETDSNTETYRQYFEGLSDKRLLAFLERDFSYKASDKQLKITQEKYRRQFRLLDDDELHQKQQSLHNQLAVSLADSDNVLLHYVQESKNSSKLEAVLNETLKQHFEALRISQKRLDKVFAEQASIIFLAGSKDNAKTLMRLAREVDMHEPFIGGGAFLNLQVDCNDSTCIDDIAPYYALSVDGLPPLATESCHAPSDIKHHHVNKREHRTQQEIAEAQYQLFACRFYNDNNKTQGFWATQGYFAASIIWAAALESRGTTPEKIASRLNYASDELDEKYGLTFTPTPITPGNSDLFISPLKFTLVPKTTGNLK
ncbi:hypothetical protein PCIT_a2984 [Pseudoalteromonas citrea]|uniref:Receptor ligand binding region domain-containing protein n=2 Tax=Pseudoalteromonas citrea TaxID=43655 RepID=A0AAD4AHW6_9GAMM|nr:ABC transporter substrate-binding protein [Pseudoalteromonas citrea]KAF7770037.1 hypothetical protein PCIT_a2984 [Pseudoalteromonas citrea]